MLRCHRILIAGLLATTALLALPAEATPIQTVSFTGTSTVTDTTATSGATTGSHTYATATFNQFNTSAGVLTGVTVGLISNRTETTSLVGTAPSGSDAKRNNASNSVSGTLTAPGVSGTIASLTQLPSCGKNGSGAPPSCPRTLTSIPLTTNASYNVSATNRSAYVGSGTVNVGLGGLLSALNTTSGGTWTGAKDSYKVDWSGSVSVAYNYQQHSEASFNHSDENIDTLTIDFGKVAKGSNPGKQFFQIFNQAQTDSQADGRIGLDFKSLTSSGNTGAFSLDTLFSMISNQAAGDGTTFGVSFDTSKLGTFTATYDLFFWDSALAGGLGFSGNSEILTITGEVVPEPASLALIGGGLLLAAGLRRRRRQS